MFDPQRPLKDIIFELIGSDGKSISALSGLGKQWNYDAQTDSYRISQSFD